MKNRFNLNEEEKNHIRGLHGFQVITEGIELNDVDLSNVPQNEDDWVKGSWDDLDSGLEKDVQQFGGTPSKKWRKH